VLGVSAEQADAVVAYRTANGPFADIEAVKKVPGIDARKLDELAEAVAF
jgi:competence ComEA-like helix-hairpin-helix protein